MPNAIFIAQIDDGSWDQDLPSSVLPAELIEAKELWEKGDDKALQLVTQFLRCSFVPIGLNVDVNDLLGVSRSHDIEAFKIEVGKLDFSKSNLPSIWAMAYFCFEPNEVLTSEKIEAWQQENDRLDNAITFEWVLPSVDDYPGLNDHLGLRGTTNHWYLGIENHWGKCSYLAQARP